MRTINITITCKQGGEDYLIAPSGESVKFPHIDTLVDKLKMVGGREPDITLSETSDSAETHPHAPPQRDYNSDRKAARD